MKLQPKSVSERSVLLCVAIWIFMLLSSVVIFRSILPILLSPIVALPKYLVLDDWRDGKSVLVYLLLAVPIIGFSTLAIFVWRRKSVAYAFLLLSLTVLWGMLFVALYFRVMYIFNVW